MAPETQSQPAVLDRRVLVAVTGASGSVYAERLIDVLRTRVARVYVLFSDTGAKVVRHELKAHEDGFSLARAAQGQLLEGERQVIRLLKNDDLFAPVASGSSAPTEMIVAPCSMGTLARIAHGLSSNLLERAADVCLKQHRRLVVCPRETPLSAVHLRNMLTLAELGVRVVPAMPGFYQGVRDVAGMVDFVVGKLLEEIDIFHELYPPWNPRLR
jgi:4-hydroxy-3-polyprenylbenzoate decarboxylase